MLPSDLYFFFETEDLSNASPLFLTQAGLVITQDTDVSWIDLFRKNEAIYFMKHYKLSEESPHNLDLQLYFGTCEQEFIFPMIKQLNQNEKIKEWPLWKLKSLVMQYFKILNSMTFRLHEACDKNLANDDPMVFPISEMKRDVVWSMALCSFIMTFGVCLNSELQRIFEETFSPFKRKFNLHINS
mmetsp:Transcript_29870/g.45648  ORF Transcript_29870/g.45648 Transcript_29870/m.45648 type:complete len:185 (+) Transcript_29870:7671-8225(+)